ncbi:MAG: hypothetical protein NTV61_07725 [Candidatus Bathyarchaeota archaeon]|nr:hypothetical protein [Candidatus Bathyarchaeota archaeon]
MKANRITAAASIILIITISVALYAYTSQQNLSIKSGNSELTLTGTLKSKSFPVTQFGPWSPVEKPFRNTDVLVMENVEVNTSKTYYLYSPGFHREMLGASAGGNGYVHGLTLDEINDAYANGLDVEVRGTPFRLSREDKEYDMLDVTEIKMIDRSKAPLVVYHSANSTGPHASGLEYFGRISLPQSFVVDRIQLASDNWLGHQQIYSIRLNDGDMVGFKFNSTQSINFKILAPNNQTTSTNQYLVEWYTVSNTTSQDGAFVAMRSGEYWFVFESDYPTTSNVTLNVWRVPYDPVDVLFLESESGDGPMGGVMSVGFYPISTTKPFTVGRTWHESYWTDHSWRFEADLTAGDVMSFAFNSTEPINFQLLKDGDIVLKTTDRYSLKQNYAVPSDGGYIFTFGIDEPKTALVSFNCRHNPEFHPTNKPAIWINYNSLRPSTTTFTPPSISATESITGRLGDEYVPLIGRVMTFTSTITKTPTTYLLHIGKDTLLPAPTSGFTLLGGFTLTDLNEAYLQGLDVQLEGIPFNLTLDNSTIRCFHINSVTIRDRAKLPILALEDLSIVSGFQSWGFGDRNSTSFPTELSLGYDYFNYYGETIYGNPEYFFHIRLQEGQAIRITVNATNPIVLGIYSHGDYPSVLSFSNASPSDYTFYEAGKKTLEIPYEASRLGYTTIALKAYGGEKTRVRLDIEWSVTD